MATPSTELGRLLDLGSVNQGADVDHLETALAEADYQLRLIEILTERAEKMERTAASIAKVGAIISVIAGAIGIWGYYFKPAQFRAVPVDFWDFAQVLGALVAMLGTLIVFRNERSRLNRVVLEMNRERLYAAVNEARAEAEGRRKLTGHGGAL